MADTTDLATWLRVQLDDDERLARRAGGRSERTWEVDLSGKDPIGAPSWPVVVRYTTDGRLRGAVAYLPIMEERSENRMAHIARHDPARVLRAIAAKQALVGASNANCPTVCRADHTFDGSCALRWMGPANEVDGQRWVRDEDGTRVPAPPVVPQWVLRLLAAEYADRADYRAEWRP